MRYKINAANDEANLYIKMRKCKVGSVELLHMYMFDSSPFFFNYAPFATPFAEHQSGESKALTKAPEQCKTGDNR